MKKALKYTLLIILISIISFVIYFAIVVRIEPPEIANKSYINDKREKLAKDFYGIKNNRLRKSESGLYELYVEGKPYERGIYHGKLTKELSKKQEDAFVEEIKKMIPSAAFLNYLKFLTAWFNRNMEDYIPEEYLYEITGEALSASKEYEFIGENYQRILNYHGAHDIGHALQNIAKVGCTSFSVNHSKSADEKLIIGRNFDFYVGDKFAEDKIISFYNPDAGYKFAMITWGGFHGVTSGINMQGLTVTLNAAKSEIPTSSANPISLIAREILQYSSNIQEAFEIAKKRKAFVAEAIMIGSANDDATAIIEITPTDCYLFNPKTDIVIGPNHFQSDELKNTELNIENIKESSSMYRYKRMQQLISKYDTINYKEVAKILRNKKGLNNEEIGMGNEKNICQLISHHSIIFKPNELKFWVSTNPYQLGKFVCYDLDSVFANFPAMVKNNEIYEEEFTIAVDSFMYIKEYKDFEYFKRQKEIIKLAIKNKTSISGEEIDLFLNSNPNYFHTFEVVANYYYSKEKFAKAKKYYKIALTKEVTTIPEKVKIEEKLHEIMELENR